MLSARVAGHLGATAPVDAIMDNRMGNVVHFMSRNDIQARPLQVVLDHGARGRGRLRRYDECFVHDLSQLPGRRSAAHLLTRDEARRIRP